MSSPNEEYILKYLAANSGMLSLADMAVRTTISPIDLVSCLGVLNREKIVDVLDPEKFFEDLLLKAQMPMNDEQLFKQLLDSPQKSSQVLIRLSEQGFRMSRK